MLLDISIISTPDELSNDILRNRAERSNGGWATEYVACIKSSETALLVLDHFQKTKTASIREIYVLEPYRLRGIATKLLKFAEEQAKVLGCCKVELEVYPLDANIGKGQLHTWYAQHGYMHSAGNQDKLQKIIHGVNL